MMEGRFRLLLIACYPQHENLPIARRLSPAACNPLLLHTPVLLLLFLLLPLTSAASAASVGEPPAVKGIQVVMTPVYLYNTLRAEDEILPVDASWHRYGGDLAITFPWYYFLGVTVGVDGARNHQETTFGDSESLNSDFSDLGTGLTLFAGSPEMGRFSIGYRWSTDFEDANSHLISLSSVSYLDAWDVEGRYAHGRSIDDGLEPNPKTISHSASLSVGRYFWDQLQVGVGFGWTLVKYHDTPILARLLDDERILTGFAEITWLLPVGDRHHFSTTLFGSIGTSKLGIKDDPLYLPIPGQDFSSYSVGLSVSFFFPGVTSLQELIREY
jgi:hypothetical protein